MATTHSVVGALRAAGFSARGRFSANAGYSVSKIGSGVVMVDLSGYREDREQTTPKIEQALSAAGFTVNNELERGLLLVA